MREFPYEQVTRDTRINRIFEGTNDILRLFIALNGFDDVGKSLKEVSSSMKGAFDDPIKGFGVMRDYALRRASIATGIGKEKHSLSGLAPELTPQVAIFDYGTRQLATVADKLLRKHGKKIIERQLATARMADIMIELFVFAAILSRVSDQIGAKGSESVQQEIAIAEAFAHRVERCIEKNTQEIDKNSDDAIKSIADHAFDREKFDFDTL